MVLSAWRTSLALTDPPARGIYAVLPRRDPHPLAPLLARRVSDSLPDRG